MKKTCFFITPMGKESSDVRNRAYAVHGVIQRVLEGFGYNPKDVISAYNISTPGVITNQVIRHILSSTLVIADLTGLNPNVMYELAIRHLTYLPVIQICDDATVLPFDIKNIRTIRYSYNGTLDNTFISNLKSSYESILVDRTSANPMGDIIDTDILGKLVGLTGVRRLSSLNEIYTLITNGMIEAKESIDDITWASTTYYRTKSDRDTYDEYEAAVHEILRNKDVKYREISNIAHQKYLWKIEDLIKYYNYSVGYYKSPGVPMVSYVIIDNRDAYVGFYRDPYLPIDNEVYLHITNPDVLDFLIDYYQTLWTVSTKIKEGDTINHRLLNDIKRSFIE